jgi:sirohydrochlorin ferrochelatase
MALEGRSGHLISGVEVQAVISHLTLILESELRDSVRGARALNGWSIFLIPWILILDFFMLLFIYLFSPNASWRSIVFLYCISIRL